MSKSLLFQIVKQILVNIVVHLFYERRFLVNGTSSPPWYTTSFWCVIHYHVLRLPYDGSCVSQGGTASYKKTFKTLYSLIQKYDEKQKNIRWIRFGTHKQPWYQQIWCFLYSINANFDSNMLVEQMVKILGKDARFILKCPYTFEL